MVVRATGINPAMLKWARERAGYSVEEVARRRRVRPERVVDWEEGRVYPTWNQLENLAYRDYHRSATFFFLNHPPEEPTIYAEFPRLPAGQFEDLQPDTLYAVRQARARQHYLGEIVPAREVVDGNIMIALRGKADFQDPGALADLVKQHIGDSPVEQWNKVSANESTAGWREWVEAAGVWVFMRRFQQEDITGFCLADLRFPVIYLNYAQPQDRKTATILRQFAHLLFDFNHIERVNDECYLSGLFGVALDIENFCNDFVREFGVPADRREPLAPTVKSRIGGPNFYAWQAMCLGRKYLRAAFRAFEEERIDESTLSASLGVKVDTLDGLERFAWYSGIENDVIHSGY